MFTEYRPIELGERSVSIPRFWEGLWAQEPGPSKRSREAIEADEIWPALHCRIPARARILDAGCGLGQWVDFLNWKGYPATGLDYSSQTIERNRKACPNAQWVCGTIQEIPFPSAEFDCVISWGIIEHDEAGPQRALREFYRVLAPNGWVFVTVPLDSKWTRRSSQIQFPEAGQRRGFFQHFFTPDELSKLLSEAQFTVEAVMPMCPMPLPVLFPRVYRLAHPLCKWKIEGLCKRIVNPLLRHRKEACAMCLAIARKAASTSRT